MFEDADIDVLLFELFDEKARRGGLKPIGVKNMRVKEFEEGDGVIEFGGIRNKTEAVVPLANHVSYLFDGAVMLLR